MRRRKPMVTVEEKESQLCAVLMENIIASPWKHTLIAHVLMRYCFRQMVEGMTPYYPGDIMEKAKHEKTAEKERVGLLEAFINFKNLPSAGNAAVLYRCITDAFDEQEIANEENALSYYTYNFGKMCGLGLSGFLHNSEEE